MPMPLGKITKDMGEYEVCDALLLAPFSHPDTWEKRVNELVSQGREAEASIVVERFGDRMTDKARRDHDYWVGRLIAWADSISEDCEGSPSETSIR